MDKKIILFELNEVPFRIVDQYCKWHPESNLARRLPECYQYETYAEDVGHLSPWTTWPTLHRGVCNERHLIANFGQDLSEADRDFPPIWKILAAHGVRTGVCGSLHTYPLPTSMENYGFFLPDTFAAGSECFPNDLSLFQDFNLIMARESARNVSGRVPWQSAIQLLSRFSELGFRMRTFMDVGKQLVSERFRSYRKSRRRTYQAVLAFDIFMKQLSRAQPGFATFFTNHVAASMHRYWAAAFPADYEHFAFEQSWVNTYSHEIDFAMGKFDEFLGRIVKFVNDNPAYELWLATSMGQAAVESRPVETQLYLTDLRKFMSALGLDERDWESRPAMLPQCNVLIRSDKIARMREALATLFIDGQPLRYREATSGFFSLDFGHPNMYEKPQVAMLGGHAVPFAELGLTNLEIDDKSSSSAYHIPDGCLLIYSPAHRGPKRTRTQVSTLELAPTLLKNFSVPVPNYMRGPVKLGYG